MCFLLDSHAHLNFPAFSKDLDETLKRAREAGVSRIINIGAGMGIEGNRAALSLAKTRDRVYASIGFHPHEAKDYNDDVSKELYSLARDSNAVAIGEIGLDYAKEYSPRKEQIRAFREQLIMARELGKPYIIHDRDAHGDMIGILREHGAPHGAVMHCYSGSLDMAQELIGMGFYISVPGTVTFNNARVLPEVVKSLPLERLLIETDSPFLTPEPNRGKRNEPAYVRYVAQKISEIKKVSFEDVARITTMNAESLFRLD